jgi:hypothetical protein
VVTASNLAVSGEPVLVSYNGGMNFGSETTRTTSARWRSAQDAPGPPWPTNLSRPACPALPARRPGGRAVRSPGSCRIPGVAPASRSQAAPPPPGDEIARNQEIYPFGRTRSSSARCSGSMGSPSLRSAPAPQPGRSRQHLVGQDWSIPGLGLLALLAGIHGLVVVLFFVSARYRLPAVPLLLLFAAGGVAAWIRRGPAREVHASSCPGLSFSGRSIANATVPHAA